MVDSTEFGYAKHPITNNFNKHMDYSVWNILEKASNQTNWNVNIDLFINKNSEYSPFGDNNEPIERLVN